MKVAIYSRKSVFTGKGESIENQVEMCKDYYNKFHDSKDVEYVIYEDEGYSGGNTKRPNFQQLLKDIKTNTYSALICYRLDRISRNVADFSSTLELLQKHSVDFISIKEQFDTSTPMGRAMVYISSVFAQLERETIAERVRDNMQELAKDGRWLGGQTPLGFDSEKIITLDENGKERSQFKLVPNEKELTIVRFIFSKYLSTSSVHQVLKELLTTETKGKNGGEFNNFSITDILKNPVYVKSDNSVMNYFKSNNIPTFGEANGNGIILYNKLNGYTKKFRDPSEWIAAVGKHKGVISSTDWINAQLTLARNSKKSTPRKGTSKKALLSGVLKCAICGAPMRVSYGKKRKDGTRNYYYMCTMKAHSTGTRCNNPNALGPQLEKDILKQLIVYKETELKKRFSLLTEEINKNSNSKLIEDIELKINSKKSEIENLLSQLSKTNNNLTQDFILKKIA